MPFRTEDVILAVGLGTSGAKVALITAHESTRMGVRTYQQVTRSKP